MVAKEQGIISGLTGNWQGLLGNTKASLALCLDPVVQRLIRKPLRSSQRRYALACAYQAQAPRVCIRACSAPGASFPFRSLSPSFLYFMRTSRVKIPQDDLVIDQ